MQQGAVREAYDDGGVGAEEAALDQRGRKGPGAIGGQPDRLLPDDGDGRAVRQLRPQGPRGAGEHAGRDVAGQLVAAAEEAGRPQRAGGLVERAGRPELLDPAVQDEGDLVGQPDCLLLVVGDEQRRHLQLLLQAADELAHLDAQPRVELRERLVEQQHLGLGHQRPGQRDPLLLPTGHLPDLTVGELGQPHQGQHPGHSLPSRRLVDLLHPQPEGDVVADAQVREQQRLLEDHRHRTALGGQVQHRLAVEQHVPGVDG